jgi:hypothetical protein
MQSSERDDALRYGPSKLLDLLIIVCVLLLSGLAYLFFLPAN